MQVDDITLCKLWKSAGGELHGPNVGMARMEGVKLLTFLRTIIKGQSHPAPEFATVKRSPSGTMMATSISARLCDSCNAVHVTMEGLDGKIFASAALSVDQAGAFARDVLDGAREAKSRRQ